MTRPLIGRTSLDSEQGPSPGSGTQGSEPPTEDGSTEKTLPLGERDRGGLPLAEDAALEKLGIARVPRGFEWSFRRQAWTRTVAVDPDGKDGLLPADAEQLALWVANLNDWVGYPAFQVSLSVPEGCKVTSSED